MLQRPSPSVPSFDGGPSSATNQPLIAAPEINSDTGAPAQLSSRPRSKRRAVFEGAAFGFIFLAIVFGWVYFQTGSLGLVLPYLRGHRLFVEPRSFDFEDAKPGAVLQPTIQIVNLTGSDVRLLGAEKSCSCLKSEEFPITVPAGVRRDLPISFQLGDKARGEGEQSLTLYTDSQEARAVTVTFRAVVR
jgi:hypothetical protein